MKKLVGLDQLLDELTCMDRESKTIVFTNGCFDVIHVGHIRLFEFAKACGDLLIVGLNSDKSVKQLKGNERPIFPQEFRAEILDSVEFIDRIVIFPFPPLDMLIREIQPDILVKGNDWLGKKVIGQDFVEAQGGEMVFAPIVEGVSTSAILGKLNNEKTVE